MLIHRLELKNLLSFRDSTIELGPLNVLIGPNAVGKSNLIEAIGLLQSAQSSISNAILRGGGVRQWISLAERDSFPVASISCDYRLTRGRQLGPLRYDLEFAENHSVFAVLKESVARLDANPESDPYYLYRTGSGIHLADDADFQMTIPLLDSVLSQFRSLNDPTPVTETGNHFSRIRIYREFRTGPQSPSRYGVATNIPKDSLLDGGDNLAMVLHLGTPHDRIRHYLNRFCERLKTLRSTWAKVLRVRFFAKPDFEKCCLLSECRTARSSSFPCWRFCFCPRLRR